MTSTLPEELLQNIFCNLRPELSEPYEGPCSQANRPLFSTLANICRASKTCYRLASPLLYETIEIHGRENYRRCQPAVSGYQPNLRPLVRTLCANSGLAEQVKQIKVEQFATTPPGATAKTQDQYHQFFCERRIGDKIRPRIADIPERPAKVDDKAQKLFDRVIEDLDISRQLQASLQDGLYHDLEDAMLAMVLALCTGLEHLELIAVFSLGNTLTMNLVDELIADNEALGLTRGRPLARLQSLAVRNEIAPRLDFGFYLDELTPLLRAPNLKTFRGHALQCVTATDDPPPLNVSPLLTRLEIDRGVLDDGGLELVLKLFPSLRELSYSEGDMIEWMFEADRVGDVLRQHGTRLEKLKLDQVEITPGVLGDLKSLKNLVEFSVDVSALLGGFDEESDAQWIEAPRLTDILPVSLKHLGLLFGDKDMKDYWCLADQRVSQLMGDHNFECLSSIELKRSGSFTQEYLAPGWNVASTDEDVTRLRRS